MARPHPAQPPILPNILPTILPIILPILLVVSRNALAAKPVDEGALAARNSIPKGTGWLA
ncbi:MAG: hypothetical protein KKE83_11725 [Proteobacteria bacterium]|nr:hypothetical protein [Pseudomonadota bacterium]MBU1545275.1 hypothetical protein [Pseudomonadota bacterium]MBU2620341.1 hypothetical protein [Pseudomonadota bacterium]